MQDADAEKVDFIIALLWGLLYAQATCGNRDYGKRHKWFVISRLREVEERRHGLAE